MVNGILQIIRNKLTNCKEQSECKQLENNFLHLEYFCPLGETPPAEIRPLRINNALLFPPSLHL